MSNSKSKSQQPDQSAVGIRVEQVKLITAGVAEGTGVRTPEELDHLAALRLGDLPARSLGAVITIEL